MTEASRPWKPAVCLEPEQTLASYVSNICVVLTPTHVQKKRRVHSNTNMPGTFHTRRNKDKELTLSCAPSVHTMQLIDKSNEKQDEFRTARQRFEPDSEDEETETTTTTTTSCSSACSFKFIPSQPKLITSKSEGRANVLPSRRRQLQQHQVSQPTRPLTEAPVQIRGLIRDSTGDTSLTREKMVHRYFGDPEQNKSCGYLTSISSHGPSEAAAAVLEQEFMSSMTYSSSATLMDETLLTVAQRAKKQLETVSKRQVVKEGRWKRIARFKPECQSFESVSKAKDQYSVLVEMDLPCSLREIMSVFSTDNSAEFHRSMEAIFGDQYVYGVNIRTADCTSIIGEGNSAVRSRSQARRASVPATWHGYDERISTNVSPLHSAKLHVNAVTLMQKHHLVWKQRNMTFMDYLEEDIEMKSVTRVMQTMDMEDQECSSLAMSSPTAVSSSQECHFQPHTQHGINLHQELKGILAGYIIQEKSDEKLTRVFFHATHHHRPSGWHGQTRMPRSAVQLLRSMVNKVCLLETVVLRRRLGYYPLTRLPTCSDVVPSCAACCVPFNMLRKKYVCRLCGHYTCRKCSDVQEIEKTVGQVEKHRVCASCVRRVSYCVFSMCAFPPKTSNVSDNSWTSTRSPQPTARNLEDYDFDAPIMDDLASNDFEHVEVFHSNQNGVFAGFVFDLLHGKDKKREVDFHRKQDFTAQRRQNLTAAKRRQRLQLNIDDLSPWSPGPLLDGHNTPTESICILDSFGMSHPSTSPRLRELHS